MDNEELFRRLSAEGRNVPDNRKKIISKAKTEGLIKDDSPAPYEVYNGGGTVSVAKSNKIIAAVASLFVLGTVAAAVAVPMIAGNNGGIPPVPPPPGLVLCTEELGTDYAIGAVSTAKLLGCFGIDDKKESGATATPAAIRREALVEQEIDVDAQINNFGTYFGAFGTFFGEGEELVSVSEGIKNEQYPNAAKYPNSIVIAGRYANGEKAEFAMYYLEALDLDYEGDGKMYYLEGEISIDKVYYYLEGSRIFPDGSSDAYDLILQAYPDKDDKENYVEMTMGYRKIDDDGEYQKSYDYKVYSGGNLQEQTLSYLPSFDRENAFNLICGYGGREDKFTFYRPEEGKPVITVGYEIGTKRSSFEVSQTRDKVLCVITNNYIFTILDEEKKTCRLTGYKQGVELSERFEIPETIKGYTVTEIGGSAFSYRQELKELVIPSTVKSIGNYAFSTCINLEKLELSEGLTSMGLWTFGSCHALKNLYIPASVTSISYNTFWNCDGLENIEVAAGNTAYSGEGNCLISISNGVLLKGALNSVIPQNASIKSIEDYAFSGVPVTSVTLPSTLTRIGGSAFQKTKLSSVVIPNSVTSIGSSAFYYCELLEEVKMSENIQGIYDSAFASCAKLSKINLPDREIVIGIQAFSGTAYMNDDSNWDVENGYRALYLGKHLLTAEVTATDTYPDVVIKSGTLTIANEAFFFRNCLIVGERFIRSFTLNKELLRIGEKAHIGGANCESIIFDGENSRYYAEGNCLIERGTHTVLAGCDGSVIPTDANITEIGPFAFSGCLAENIVIPANISRICEEAFSYCGMTKLVIPNTVHEIQQNAYSYCANLQEVKFEEQVKTGYGYYNHLNVLESFCFCQNLNVVLLPAHVYGARAFRYCTNLYMINVEYNSQISEDMPYLKQFVEECPNVEIRFTGTSEEWLKHCMSEADMKLMPYRAVVCSDDRIFTPDYHE